MTDDVSAGKHRPAGERPRGTIAEWTVTIILLLFGTTTLVQAFVIPTGSMEDTLLIGDHLLVDKLAYAPAGPVSKYILPYQEIKRGDIIVFRYPMDVTQTYVKRVVGIPGDRIHIRNKQVFRNGEKLNERTIAAAAAAAADESRPIDDFRAGGAYRRQMVDVLVARGLNAIAAQGTGKG